MATKKYYGVKQGRAPGVYETWEACKQQVHAYPGAVFKAFPTREDAERYIGTSSQDGEQKRLSTGKGFEIYVDGSFSRGKNLYSWAFVVYLDGELVFSDSGVGENREAASVHNVAGELAATMRAVKWAADNDKKPVVIYHDYMGIAAWALDEWKAKNKFTQAYKSFMVPYLDWVVFQKVQGHSGVEGNELADKLAGEAIRRLENDETSSV